MLPPWLETVEIGTARVVAFVEWGVDEQALESLNATLEQEARHAGAHWARGDSGDGDQSRSDHGTGARPVALLQAPRSIENLAHPGVSLAVHCVFSLVAADLTMIRV